MLNKKNQTKLPELRDLGPNIEWSFASCKRCSICTELCPKKNLEIVNNNMTEKNQCIYCGLCEMYCPDFAIKVKPKKKK